MADRFHTLYASMLKDVFLEKAQGQVSQGQDSIACAKGYAQQGKPDFTLAYLLLSEIDVEEKQNLLAEAYEQRALFSEEKAEALSQQFQRAFPLIKLEAQKDRSAAQRVRQGQPIHRSGKALNPG
ncbi:hypothetical protein [Tengunoibacter tsumagoiensis]|uniref:Uncharacterized protein n=1 Tax=Tengunoibacter tsumagoiensis TaxID=2014871 RepID=A0A402A4T5_9CHLR|nr:hypothetical protein [Tengunoibacter tsumagoiensis]GCE14110.1 hypothetical protein KTT_39690 [Tengunoibacter tsumagoiensis]